MRGPGPVFAGRVSTCRAPIENRHALPHDADDLADRRHDRAVHHIRPGHRSFDHRPKLSSDHRRPRHDSPASALHTIGRRRRAWSGGRARPFFRFTNLGLAIRPPPIPRDLPLLGINPDRCRVLGASARAGAAIASSSCPAATANSTSFAGALILPGFTRRVRRVTTWWAPSAGLASVCPSLLSVEGPTEGLQDAFSARRATFVSASSCGRFIPAEVIFRGVRSTRSPASAGRARASRPRNQFRRSSVRTRCYFSSEIGASGGGCAVPHRPAISRVPFLRCRPGRRCWERCVLRVDRAVDRRVTADVQICRRARVRGRGCLGHRLLSAYFPCPSGWGAMSA